MRDKKYIIYNFLILIVLSVMAGILIVRLDKTNYKSNQYISQEKITDECTEEGNEMYSDIAASSTELKLSPNAELIVEKYYTGCGHTINEYAEILPEMVNKNQEEIEDMYQNLKVQSFEKNKLIIEKNEPGFCGEHYILRDKDGVIIVNNINENNEETLYEKTSIATQYLTQTDIINLKEGIRIYGKENLNSMLEDYE